MCVTKAPSAPRSPSRRGSLTLLALLAFTGPAALRAGERAPGLAVVGGTVHTGTGRVIPDGTVLIEEGRVTRVGPRSEVVVPEGLSVIDASEKVVIPGLV